jgi:hypothetical protein
MSTMRSQVRSLKARLDERGAALPFIALMLVVLIGMAALAIDLGWIYLNASRVQRGADAAALAGVIHLPADTDEVTEQTVNGANANGWSVGTVNGTPISGGGPDILAWEDRADNQLEVTLTATVPTFFIRVFGMDEVTIARKSTAEYVKPVPLGSPGNCFGIGPNITSGPAGAADSWDLCNNFSQNFWAAINGRRTAKEHGDPFAVQCITASNNSCNGANGDFDPFYHYAIEMPEGKDFVDIYLYDPGYYDRPNLFTETGDIDSLTNSGNGGTGVRFQLFKAPIVAEPLNNLALVTCNGGGSNTLELDPEESSATFKNRWGLMCRINTPEAGLYVLRLTNFNNQGGNNGYAVMAHTNGVNGGSTVYPKVFALNYMSIYSNADDATVYLADVQPVHAGKTLVLRFFDPGEADGQSGTMTIVPPPGVPATTCSWTATNGSSNNSCTITTTSGGNALFNSHWITVNIRLPEANVYNCTTDCFWKVNLDLGNSSHDRTTWTANVIGNPVRLVPNQTATP